MQDMLKLEQERRNREEEAMSSRMQQQVPAQFYPGLRSNVELQVSECQRVEKSPEM
jgi:hypothetical protein